MLTQRDKADIATIVRSELERALHARFGPGAPHRDGRPKRATAGRHEPWRDTVTADELAAIDRMVEASIDRAPRRNRRK